MLEDVAARRPNTALANFDAGRVVHHDQSEAFAAAVRG